MAADEKIAKIERDFSDKLPLLESGKRKLQTLIEEILLSENLRVHSVTSRVKSVEKLAEKIRRPEKNYDNLGQITDQLGFRIITYYEDEVDVITELIRREFGVDNDNSIDKRIQSDPEKFAYSSMHLVCALNAARTDFAEYRHLSGIYFEIQIRSILQHAWAEMEHDWYDMQSNLPHDIRRRFSRLAGLLEIADSEFLSLRKTKDDLGRSVAVLLESDSPVSGVLLNEVSVAAYLEQDSFIRSLDKEIATLRRLPYDPTSVTSRIKGDIQICLRLGIDTLQILRERIEELRPLILKYNEISVARKTPSSRATVNSGASMRGLTMLLLAKKSDSEIAEFIASVGLKTSAASWSSVAAAREALKAMEVK